MKKLFLKISQYLQENTCVGVSFLIKLQPVRTATLIKRDCQDRCFLVNITKFLRTPILKNICERLLLFGGELEPFSMNMSMYFHRKNSFLFEQPDIKIYWEKMKYRKSNENESTKFEKQIFIDFCGILNVNRYYFSFGRLIWRLFTEVGR